MICTIRPIAHVLAGALREHGHEPVALVAPRPAAGADEPPEAAASDRASAPAGVDLLFARDKWSIERLLRAYEPDLTVCWGFPWKLPQAALDVARLGSINQHPALLASPPRPDPVRVDTARRRHRLGLHVASHGRRARHRQHPRAGQQPGPGRRLQHRRVRAAAARAGGCAAAAGARPGRGRRSRRPPAGRGRDLGRPLRGRRLRAHRLVAAGPPGPRPGARMASDVRALEAARSGGGARRRGGRGAADAAERPRRAPSASSAATARSGSSRASPS